jgi:hypothetical protein
LVAFGGAGLGSFGKMSWSGVREGIADCGLSIADLTGADALLLEL